MRFQAPKEWRLAYTEEAGGSTPRRVHFQQTVGAVLVTLDHGCRPRAGFGPTSMPEAVAELLREIRVELESSAVPAADV
ncbi:MAG TPA: hypothetical protein VKK19_01380 [Candidatus Dormibacteraeota bacterium]|nr:hypothetical protein [Candidatus Dormibacteraeota bacterium]